MYCPAADRLPHILKKHVRALILRIFKEFFGRSFVDQKTLIQKYNAVGSLPRKAHFVGNDSFVIDLCESLIIMSKTSCTILRSRAEVGSSKTKNSLPHNKGAGYAGAARR